jgi:hypothetical protein
MRSKGGKAGCGRVKKRFRKGGERREESSKMNFKSFSSTHSQKKMVCSGKKKKHKPPNSNASLPADSQTP